MSTRTFTLCLVHVDHRRAVDHQVDDAGLIAARDDRPLEFVERLERAGIAAHRASGVVDDMSDVGQVWARR
ncbi:MAG: hypothetical protein ACHREM_16500 [Polyangiales bacterium]